MAAIKRGTEDLLEARRKGREIQSGGKQSFVLGEDLYVASADRRNSIDTGPPNVIRFKSDYLTTLICLPLDS